MEDVHAQLERWRQSLCPEISIAGLLSRCPTAHKWKAPARSLVVREGLLWRMHDLGMQTVLLTDQGHILGARILLRRAIETLCLLIYLNQKTEAVLSGTLPFFDFDEITKQLLMGSKNGQTSIAAVNIRTVLKHADKAHPGILSIHEHLSESAHPNYDGVLYGYSNTDPDKFETHFSNNWKKYFGDEQTPGTAFVLAAFEHEYNITWTEQLERLEQWLRDNDAALEAQRAGS